MPNTLSEIEDRLVSTFETVFPNLSSDEIRSAEQSNIEDWDSITAINLITVLEEQFDVELDFEEASKHTSFRGIANYLFSKLG